MPRLKRKLHCTITNNNDGIKINNTHAINNNDFDKIEHKNNDGQIHCSTVIR